jgi:hypothetical protein
MKLAHGMFRSIRLELCIEERPGKRATPAIIHTRTVTFMSA